MKYYTITVNGNTYEVSVEEKTSSQAPSMNTMQNIEPVPMTIPQPVKAPVIEKPATPTPMPSVTQANSMGSVKVSSPMPGKILAIKANIGQTVKKGEVILILEAMKMENEIVSSQDGTVSSIDVTIGQSVEAGTLLATLK